MSLHINTPRMSVFEPRGLSVRTVDYCRVIEDGPVEPRINRTLHDAAGHAVKQWDPRLWLSQAGDPLTSANLTQAFSLDATVIRSDSVDAGTQIELKGLATQTVLGWDSRQMQREIEHDNLLRPVAIFEQGAGEPRRCVERLTYGHPDSGDQSRNQFGQLIRHDHPAGSVLFTAFAISGPCTEDTRHFTLDPLTPDWPEQEADRLRLLEPGVGATSRWRHGALGDVLEQTDARDNRHTFALTIDGRLRERRLQLKGEPEQVLVTDIRYNAQGNVTRQTAGNRVQTSRTYRPEDDRLSGLWSEDAHGLVLQHLSYEYDRMGNVLSIEDKALPIRYFANQRIDPASRFVYDSLDQLIMAFGWEAGSASQGPQSTGRVDPAAVCNYQQIYEYDPGGNLRNLIHVGPQSHGRKLQPTSYSNRALSYDDIPPDDAQIEAAYDRRGNLLQLEPGRPLTWSLRNQLQSVSPVERASGTNDSETYLYDGGHQRVRKLRSLQTGSRTLIADVRYLSGLELRGDTGIGTGERLQVIIADNARVQHWESPPPSGLNNRYRYQHVDHLGSVSLETADDGAVISRETFHPFGTSAWQDGELNYRFVRYSGKERDATGLYYYGFRYYISWLQRWLNPDPAGAIDGHNRFWAMRNSPVVYVDNDGRAPNRTLSTKAPDQVYHDLAQQGKIEGWQAAGMQPIRNFFERSEDPNVQAYRREIPRALEELSANDNRRLLNTHQAHVIAAARIQTASPSGAVLYHSGEIMSAAISTVIGEQATSRIMGPLSVAFNSPVEDPQVLAARRDAVASGFVEAGRAAFRSSRPAVRVVGAVSMAMGNAMRVSESATVTQYRMLSSTPESGAVMLSAQRTAFEQPVRPVMVTESPSSQAEPGHNRPSALARTLLAVASESQASSGVRTRRASPPGQMQCGPSRRLSRG
ncbi:RHS repeat domain-containing protein [Pseudomonas fluorescens]|uniref:RHS repeat domain-containing protein n=1 Tax=Pseudomonas fluorescens TaxID=294 RepID=UPI00259BE71D|nr:RHS repeat-associated core domain-containing protein [Pseudomonas fluorescens]WJK10909.1 RHS repeat-associated core domain-containing protein [Pseudomonas fluorescens]